MTKPSTRNTWIKHNIKTPFHKTNNTITFINLIINGRMTLHTMQITCKQVTLQSQLSYSLRKEIATVYLVDSTLLITE